MRVKTTAVGDGAKESTMRYTYDRSGNCTGICLPEKLVRPEQYEALTDSGAGCCNAYDAQGRITEVTGPDGQVLVFQFGDSIIEIETNFDERFYAMKNSYLTISVEKLNLYDENL